MEFKVKAVESPENISAVEIEETLIAAAEAKADNGIEATEGEVPVINLAEETAEEVTEDVVETETPEEEPSISEEDVLSF